MKKQLTAGFPVPVEVETDGELWGFRAGDIVQWDESTDTRHYVVEGFRDLELWMISVDDDEIVYSTANPDGLILLNRPTWPFKVGDRVRHVDSNLIGTVIVLDPRNEFSNHFIVEFPGWQCGSSKDLDWATSWYPVQHKTPRLSRVSCISSELRLIESFAPAPALPSEDVAGEPTNTPDAGRVMLTMSDGERISVNPNGIAGGFRCGDYVRIPAMYSPDNLIIGTDNATRTMLIMQNKCGRNLLIKSSDLNNAEPGSFILLSRAGWKFKVGDHVRITKSGLSSWGLVGIVRVLDPTADTKRYLVETLDLTTSHDALHWWHAHWFPQELIPEVRNRNCVYWYDDEEMSPVEQSVSPTPKVAEKKDDPAHGYGMQRQKAIRCYWLDLKAHLEKGELPVFDPRQFKINEDGVTIIDYGAIGAAPNLPECLRRLGVTLFHLTTEESELNHERYEADPKESYERLMPKGQLGEVIRFLLFGKAKTIEEVEARFAWLTDEQTTALPEPTAEVHAETKPETVVESSAAKPNANEKPDEDTLLIEDIQRMIKDAELNERAISMMDAAEPTNEQELLERVSRQVSAERVERLRQKAFAKLVEAGLDEDLATKILENPLLPDTIVSFIRDITRRSR